MSTPSPEEYRARLREHLAGLLDPARSAPETVPLAGAAGRVLAADVAAPVSLPLFRNSQMDGYAACAAEVDGASPESPLVVPVARTVAAGDPPGEPPAAGTVVKIMTGAPLPDGTDCVVPVEETAEVEQSGHRVVALCASPSAGTFVRSPGDDVEAGRLVLSAGTVLAARHLAAAASLGIADLPVAPRPRVAVLATGSELVPPGATPGPGQIWESNSTALAASAREVGAEVVTAAVVGDDPDTFRSALDAAAESADLVITAGAVSMGDFEVVRDELAARPDSWFGHIAMQPGGPQGLATWAGTPVVCLPGNPVSVLVSFVVLLRDVLLEAAGRAPLPPGRSRLARAVTSPPGRAQFLRGRLEGDAAHPVSGPGSHLVATMAAADVLVEVPPDDTDVAAGTPVRVWPLDVAGAPR